MTRISTPFSEKLGLRLPLIAAPMAGGPTSPELVAACSAAGALGSFGFAYTQPDDMRKQVAAVRAKTGKPIGINLFVSPQPAPVTPEAQRAALGAVAGYFKEMGMPAPEPVKPPYAPDLEAQLAAVADIRPGVFTVHLDLLPREKIDIFKKLNILVGGSATCAEEARRLEQAGYDFVIAQGGEAGGHRGTYLRDPYAALTGTLALTRIVLRAVKLPVVAAGGIMDGEGIAAVLALGAQAAQLGTAFIPCPEGGAPQVHKDSLLKAKEDETAVTTKFSGKLARGLANRFMKETTHAPQIAFPAQNAITVKLRQASAKAGKPDFVALWAGQGAPLSRALPAADLIGKLEAETIAAIRRTTTLLRD
jgi:nitronate monooxygenase